jgi:uncharacterized protein (TIGR02271 family)
MSRTVTALYDTRAEAEAARQRLSSEVSLDRIKIIDKDGGGSSGGGSGGGLGGLYLSREDRHAYGEGIRRGGFLLCADVESGEDADKIIRLLEESTSVDIDERQNSWRSEGWSPQAATGATSGGGSASGSSAGATSQVSGNVVAEEHIPIVEEELRVGKREAERGGARVRSYVREIPVQDQVTLREEHVSVERRPVEQGQAQSVAGGKPEDLLQDREIVMRETVEEAVVQKVANVREEVVVRKTAEEHVEQVNETVRHTEVDVENGGSGDRSAFSGFGAGGEKTGTGEPTEGFERDRTR